MIPATTTKPTHKKCADHDDQHAAGRETTAANKPPPHDDTEHDEHEREWTEDELRAHYQLDDPRIRAMAARGGVPDAELAVRLGRMLGFARHPRR